MPRIISRSERVNATVPNALGEAVDAAIARMTEGVAPEDFLDVTMTAIPEYLNTVLVTVILADRS